MCKASTLITIVFFLLRTSQCLESVFIPLEHWEKGLFQRLTVYLEMEIGNVKDGLGIASVSLKSREA